MTGVHDPAFDQLDLAEQTGPDQLVEFLDGHDRHFLIRLVVESARYG